MAWRGVQNRVYFCLWAVLVGGSYLLLVDYKGIPGEPGNPPQSWPNDSCLKRDAYRFTLVMLAHPHCPCTRASVDSLARLLGRFPQQVAAYVLFLKPEEEPAGWEQTDLWRQAENIPGVTAVADSQGREATRFGAATSGHALLFAADGRLLYSGGITPARGHGGACLGLDTLGALLEGKNAPPSAVPVFGCPLHDPGSICTQEGKQCDLPQ